MLIDRNQTKTLHTLFHIIKLRKSNAGMSDDQKTKIEQILSYLEVIDAQVRKLSKKRKLVFVDSAAGNCYLSFLVYHYYRNLCGREIEIHCIDINGGLMDNSREIAASLEYGGMHFHTCDILEFAPGNLPGPADVAYSLHACDTATDKALYLGVKLGARSILSVSCCQHSLGKSFRNNALKGVTRYKSFKSRLLYIIADTMRAHLLEMEGYKVDIFDFTSTRYTDKNVMIRAKKGGRKFTGALEDEYRTLYHGFNIRPELERLLHPGEEMAV